MIKEIVLFTVLLVAVVGLLLFFRLRETRYVRRRTREAISPSLQEEIEEERSQARTRKEKFENALRQASHAASKQTEIQLKKS